MYVILHIEFSSEMFCTHRQYDIRIGLYNYEYVTEGEPLHAVVREMVGTLSFPARHLVQFKPKMARWNIHVLRCKRKTTFLLDDRFTATVNCMSEHTFDVEKGQVIELDLKMEQHTQVEVSMVGLRLSARHNQCLINCSCTTWLGSVRLVAMQVSPQTRRCLCSLRGDQSTLGSLTFFPVPGRLITSSGL